VASGFSSPSNTLVLTPPPNFIFTLFYSFFFSLIFLHFSFAEGQKMGFPHWPPFFSKSPDFPFSFPPSRPSPLLHSQPVQPLGFRIGYFNVFSPGSLLGILAHALLHTLPFSFTIYGSFIAILGSFKLFPCTIELCVALQQSTTCCLPPCI